MFKDHAFIQYLNEIKDVYNSIEEYNPWMKTNVLIVFDDMIVDRI